MYSFPDVELGFVVNLKTFREVLESLRVNGKRWWVASDPEDALKDGVLLVGHGDPGCSDRLNAITYRVPVLTGDWGREGAENLVLLIEPSVVMTDQPGLYLGDDKLVRLDSHEDWVCFYMPVKRALMAILQAGG